MSVKRFPVRSQYTVTLVLNRDEHEWFIGLKRQFGLRASDILRLGINEAARELGVPCGVRLKAQSQKDTDDPRRGRAIRDLDAIVARRSAGETVKALAHEYGVATGYLYHLMSRKRRGGLESIRQSLREAALRIADDPFCPITERQREIMLAIGTHRTFADAANTLGLTPQRVSQVATLVGQMSGIGDGRRKVSA